MGQVAALEGARDRDVQSRVVDELRQVRQLSAIRFYDEERCAHQDPLSGLDFRVVDQRLPGRQARERERGRLDMVTFLATCGRSAAVSAAQTPQIARRW